MTSETESMTETGKALKALHDVVGAIPLLRLVAADDTRRVAEAWHRARDDRGSASAESLVEFFHVLRDAAPTDVSGWPEHVLDAAAAAETALTPLVVTQVISPDLEAKILASMDRMAAADLAVAPPPSNATCRCGAPSLALFSSHECSRGPECPIVAGEPEPEWFVRTRRGERIYVATGEGYIAEHPLREGAIAAWRAKVAAKPKVAIGVDLATGPDRGAIVGRVVDATPDADGCVTIQWRAPVVTAQARADVEATIDKALSEAAVGQWMPHGMYRTSNGHDAPCALCVMLLLDPDAAQAGHVCTCGRHPERAVRS